ncbi:MAG: YiiD C-terminal domain-containing protein [Prolixibacteraceae bacterium]
MNVLEIPFNKFLGIDKADPGSGFIFKLEPKSEYLNHLATVHAGALFALAEASSGEFLLRQFNDYELAIIPVVRKVEVKYSKPANGSVFSSAVLVDSTVPEIIDALNTRKRTVIQVKVDLYSVSNERLFTSVFDWFLTLNQEEP